MLLLINNSHAQTTYAQFGSTPGEINDDGTGQIMIGQVGIGGTSASAKLHVKTSASADPVIRATYVNASPNPDHYFLAEKLTMGGPPSFNISTRTDLVINNQGYIGIGADDPEEPLYIRHKTYYTPTAPYYSPFATNRLMVMRDDDDYDLVSFANTGSGTTHGGALMIRAIPDATMPSLAIYNGLTNTHLAAYGNGAIGMGTSMTGQPVAHLDIRKITTLDYLFNIANSDNTLPYFNVHEGGNVGIGVIATSSTAKLSVKGNLDLYYNSSTAPALRINTSAGVTRHLVTDIANNLIIAPGVGGGANSRVVINGELETTDDVTVNGSLTIKSGSGNEFKVGTDGKVRAREVQVDLLTIPDYVFDKNYSLPTIEELNTFIEENKHLPNIPSECEYEKRGAINMGELNIKLLEKVEELSLYIIQLNERVKTLENEK